MQSSTGRMECFDDGINAVIAQVRRLTEQGIEPHNIILKGNCLGAWIAGGVQDELSKQGIMVRVVRSNTFSSTEEVVLAHTPGVFKPIVKQFTPLMKTLGWSYDASEHNLVNGPFNLMVNRPGDKILGEDSLLAPKLAWFRESIPEEEMLIPDVSRVWWTNFTHIFSYFQSLLVPYNY